MKTHRSADEFPLWAKSFLSMDLAIVDALARLQLAARRAGFDIRIVDPPERLLELIDLAGLRDVLLTKGNIKFEGETNS
jgi:anti-anti-sigma regulatory factor